MEKVITIETSAKAGLLLALTAMGVTPSNTEDKNGSTEITVDLTDDQVKTLEQAFNNGNATVGMMIRDGLNRVTEVVADAARFAVVDLTIPVATVGVKVAANAGRIAVEGAAQAGASVINNLVEESVKAVAGVKQNDECQKLSQSWATIKGLFAKKPNIKIS